MSINTNADTIFYSHDPDGGLVVSFNDARTWSRVADEDVPSTLDMLYLNVAVRLSYKAYLAQRFGLAKQANKADVGQVHKDFPRFIPSAHKRFTFTSGEASL